MKFDIMRTTEMTPTTIEVETLEQLLAMVEKEGCPVILWKGFTTKREPYRLEGITQKYSLEIYDDYRET